eukprot:1513893-Rhodomonas_salina.1
MLGRQRLYQRDETAAVPENRNSQRSDWERWWDRQQAPPPPPRLGPAPPPSPRLGSTPPSPHRTLAVPLLLLLLEPLLL